VLVNVGIGVVVLITEFVGWGVGVLPQADTSKVKVIDDARKGRMKFFIF